MLDPLETVLRIGPAETPADLAAARALFRDYARSLRVDLSIEGFYREMATLPGDYAPPRGRFLLARYGDEAIGCAGLRPLDSDRCEMKRLYVHPDHRGHGTGRRLVESMIAEAWSIGYRRMVLHTLDTMHEARALFASLGSREIPAYYAHCSDGMIYAELDLATAAWPIDG